MPEESLRKVRERSEREYQELVERIADRVWEILKKNTRHDKERRGTDRGARHEH